MDPYNLKKLNSERRARRAAILVTDLADGRDRVVGEADAVAGELGEAMREGSGPAGPDWSRLMAAVSSLMCMFRSRGSLSSVRSISVRRLAPMAKIAGYDVEIIDPRTAFATSDRFPDVVLHAEWPQDALKARPLDSYTALAAVTHDPKIDDFALKAALDAGCFYVGALGSRKTHAKRVERLLALGVAAEAIARIQAPIGLDIGASSPAEIAVAVLAELISALRLRGAHRETTGEAA